MRWEPVTYDNVLFSGAQTIGVRTKVIRFLANTTEATRQPMGGFELYVAVAHRDFRLASKLLRAKHGSRTPLKYHSPSELMKNATWPLPLRFP